MKKKVYLIRDKLGVEYVVIVESEISIVEKIVVIFGGKEINIIEDITEITELNIGVFEVKNCLFYLGEKIL
ncbi:MAG: hypothetical protein KAS66_09800 [Candidatus Omnitrophica bacterium]|nr:hypothetical protein [Candidatus Omnitrophota bacterium]